MSDYKRLGLDRDPGYRWAEAEPEHYPLIEGMFDMMPGTKLFISYPARAYMFRDINSRPKFVGWEGVPWMPTRIGTPRPDILDRICYGEEDPRELFKKPKQHPEEEYMKEALKSIATAILCIVLTLLSFALSYVCFRHQSSAGFEFGAVFLLAPIAFWFFVLKDIRKTKKGKDNHA